VIAFVRGEAVVTVVPVGTTLDPDATVDLPAGRWRGLDDLEYEGAPRACELVAQFPVAILERAA
jgi:hypothetical protein